MDASSFLERIRQIDSDLVIETVDVNEEGLVNTVVIINQKLAFRFAKGAYGIRALRAELSILDLLYTRLPVVIPHPFHREEDVIAYSLISGKPLCLTNLTSLNTSQQQALARQLGEILYRLHHLPLSKAEHLSLSATPAPCKQEDFVRLYQQVEEILFPLLMKHQRDWAIRLFDPALSDSHFFEWQPCLVHGDLGCYHLLFDEEKVRITGLIDFGVSGIGDAAVDIAALLNDYGERFVEKMSASYPGLSELLPRARFYAQSVELQWVLSGLRSGENFWFTAHLGRARDLG